VPQYFSFFPIGVINGTLYPLVLWCTKLWMKQDGCTNTVIGIVNLLAFPAIFKPVIVHYMNQIMPHQNDCKHAHYKRFALSVAIYAAGLFGMALAQPKKILCFGFFIFVSVVGAMLVEVFSEVLRVSVSHKHHVMREKILAMFGVGYRVGAMVIKMGVVTLATLLLWQKTFLLVACVLMALAWLTRPIHGLLKDIQVFPSYKGKLWEALRTLKTRHGFFAFIFPLIVPFADTFLRSMLGVLLIEFGFDLKAIALCYGLAHGAGFFGVLATLRFLRGWNDYRRLCASYVINIFFLLGLLWGALHLPRAIVYCLAVLAGCSQGIFLQILRGVLGALSEPQYVAEHMATFFALWALGSTFACVAGWVVDALGWPLFLLFGGIFAIFGLLAIYFMFKKSNNAL